MVKETEEAAKERDDPTSYTYIGDHAALSEKKKNNPNAPPFFCGSRIPHSLSHITTTWTKLELAACIIGAGMRARTSSSSRAMNSRLTLPSPLLVLAVVGGDSKEGVVESNVAMA